MVAVEVGVELGVSVGLSVAVFVGVFVSVSVGLSVTVGVSLGVSVGVKVGVTVAVLTGVEEGEEVAVEVMVAVRVWVGVAVGLLVGVLVITGVFVGGTGVDVATGEVGLELLFAQAIGRVMRAPWTINRLKTGKTLKRTFLSWNFAVKNSENSPSFQVFHPSKNKGISGKKCRRALGNSVSFEKFLLEKAGTPRAKAA
jgi:hypothetical protein